MTQKLNHVHVGGTCFAIASSLMIAVLVLHGPIAPSLTDQMAGISERATMWKVLHWTAAGSLSLYALGGLAIVTAASRLTDSLRTTTAWAIVPLGAIGTAVTAVAEATVVADAAANGSLETYAAWWAFSEGMANGFVLLALAVAVIAWNEVLGSERVTPAWAGWTGTFAGAASACGWVLGMWFEVRIGNVLWIVASITMCIWTLWFGVGLVRSVKKHSQVATAVS